MSDIELKHTWELDRNSKVVRFYKWMWDASDKDVNFCSMFWGYVFAVPNLVIRAFAWPFQTVGRAFARKFPAPDPPEPGTPEYAAMEEQTAALNLRRARRKQLILKRIENGAVRVVWAFTTFWRYARYIVVPAVGLASLGFVIATLVWLAYLVTTINLGSVPWPTIQDIALGGALSVMVVATCTVFVLSLRAFASRGWLDWVPSFGLGALTVIVAPIMFFAWVMKIGFVSIKSNTCPRIELTDGPKPEPEPKNDDTEGWG